ncbi:hypothetical protein SEVIR_2G199300v4 [Setaria viridis]|uniref:Uncharacterized protein n=1 Tax=Setaria viridis TaxID=4556 RepID=A0A4U6W5Z8_SETVI|nr:hypothetical protein SEVIR_2G199300v2 [Setaria viridis]
MATRRWIRPPRVVPVLTGSASCTAAAAFPRGRALLDLRRWMLFPEGFSRFLSHHADSGHARFLDLFAASDGTFVCVPLLELKNHCILDSPDGLLLQRDGDTTDHLFHSFACDVVDFPDIDHLPHQLHELE